MIRDLLEESPGRVKGRVRVDDDAGAEFPGTVGLDAEGRNDVDESKSVSPSSLPRSSDHDLRTPDGVKFLLPGPAANDDDTNNDADDDSEKVLEEK